MTLNAMMHLEDVDGNKANHPGWVYGHGKLLERVVLNTEDCHKLMKSF